MYVCTCLYVRIYVCTQDRRFLSFSSHPHSVLSFESLTILTMKHVTCFSYYSSLLPFFIPSSFFFLASVSLTRFFLSFSYTYIFSCVIFSHLLLFALPQSFFLYSYLCVSKKINLLPLSFILSPIFFSLPILLSYHSFPFFQFCTSFNPVFLTSLPYFVYTL